MSKSTLLVATVLGGIVGGVSHHAMLTSAAAPEAKVRALRILSTPEQDALDLPFAEGVQIGDVIVLSGQIGAPPGSLQLVPGGVKAQTRQALLNIQAALERYGSSMQRVFKCTVFLRDMADWPAMNEVYVEMFDGHRPARSALGASGLALDGEVEIECFALVNAD